MPEAHFPLHVRDYLPGEFTVALCGSNIAFRKWQPGHFFCGKCQSIAQETAKSKPGALPHRETGRHLFLRRDLKIGERGQTVCGGVRIFRGRGKKETRQPICKECDRANLFFALLRAGEGAAGSETRSNSEDSLFTERIIS